MKEFDCPHCHRIFNTDPGDQQVVSCPHCNGTVETPEKDLPPGTMIGGFEIIRLLGHGGMGNVYLANQVSMNRPVALKVLLKSMTQDKESVRQFLNEARVSGQMNHRNIITAIDAGESEDRYYLVTNFVDGHDIEKRLEEDKEISEKESLEIAFKITDALRYAWENHGLLHKDIKPGNIMLDSGGEPYLMDMGIAQFIGDAPSQEEHIVGSPFYMSPEQTRGERLSWTSDQYSLGATLYNMIVGFPPYDADDVMKIIEMHTESPFPMPKSRNPNVKISKPTVMLLKKMMAKTPNERFDSWGGVREAVNKALRSVAGKKGGAKKKANAKKTPQVKKRRRAPVQQKKGGGGIMLLLVILILLGFCFGAAFYFFNKNKYDQAKQYLKSAETYYQKYPGPNSGAVSKFRFASDAARGTKLEPIAQDRLLEVLAERKRQLKLIKEYNEKLKMATDVANDKNYRAAIKIIEEALQGINDKATKREAEMIIELYKGKL